jgi:pimeloyl-ACP methyl ester carboxylesterase
VSRHRAGALLLFLHLALAAGASVCAAPLDLRPCRVGEAAEDLRCAELAVPENWAKPEGRQIRLNIMVVPALRPDPSQPPLFDLDGGPGSAVTQAASFYATDGRGYRERRPVVLVDQRGTGRSSPLRCPEIEGQSPLERMYAPEAVRRCRKALGRKADLAQYTTAAAARDLEAVRTALDTAQVDLSAISYGTRLALHYLRRYPDRVRSAALIGTVGKDKRLPLGHARFGQRVLDQVFDQCAADPLCAAAYPNLRDDWRRLQQSLESDGLQATWSSEGGTTKIRLRRGPFDEALRSLLVSTTGQRQVPFLVHEMAHGRYQPFLDRVLGGPRGGLAEGLYLSVTCAEDTPRITDEQVQVATAGTFLGRYRIDEQRGACAVWQVPAVRDEAGPDVRPEVPVLLLVGELDYVTPPEWSREVAATLPRSRVVVVPGLGHAPEGLSSFDCFEGINNSFFATPDPQALDLACLATMKPLPFVLPRPPIVPELRYSK